MCVCSFNKPKSTTEKKRKYFQTEDKDAEIQQRVQVWNLVSLEWGRNAQRMLLLTWKSSAVSVKCRVYMRLPSVRDEGMSLHIRAKWKIKHLYKQKNKHDLFAFFSVFGLSATFYLVAFFYFPQSLRTHRHTFILTPIWWEIWKNPSIFSISIFQRIHWIWLRYQQQA